MEMTGREFMAASQTIEDTNRVYRIRYRSDVAVTDRLIESGLEFEIHNIRELGRRAGLELQCRALTPAQPIT